MHITGMVHININCTDFQRSKAFYEMLGFQVYWPVPETNTEEVANAVGMPKYQVEGALMALQNADQPMVIDLLEWKSPRDDSPPYPNLYRPGLARIALSSSDIDADFDFLVANGVKVVSQPVNVHTSETEVLLLQCGRTFLELLIKDRLSAVTLYPLCSQHVRAGDHNKAIKKRPLRPLFCIHSLWLRIQSPLAALAANSP